MPCRKGCSPPTAGPVCCCARRCSGRHRPQGEFCTADTCSNPQFCIAYRPQFCPNAHPNQENPAAESPQPGNWPSPPPFPEITTPWPPPNSHHPLSSTQNPRHSNQSFSSQQSLSTRQPCCQNHQPYPPQSPRKSAARLSIGKPSLARLDSGQNPFECLSRPGSRSAMRLRLATIGRPSLTRFDLGSQADRYKQDDSSFEGAGVRFGALSRHADHCGRGSWTGGLQQGPETDEDDFATDSPGQGARCECRMPPAFARYRCTGNLGGLCDCPKCDDNK